MERSSIFDAIPKADGTPDRVYLAEDFANYFKPFFENGVFPNPSTNLQVIANDDMTVTVKAGKGWINGYYYHNTDDLILPIDVADGAINRIDSIVLQYRGAIDDVDKGIVGRMIIAQVKKGTFSFNPTAPTLQRNSNYFELQIATIAVNAGAIKITQADITDTRLNTKLCGIVHNPLEHLDTTTLFNQYKSWYEQTTGKAVKNLAEFEAQFKADTIAWVESLKKVLDKNTATNLLNKINDNTKKIKTNTNTLLAKADETICTCEWTANFYLARPKSLKFANKDIFTLTFKAPKEFIKGEKIDVYNSPTSGTFYNLYANGELATEAWKKGDVVTLNFDRFAKKAFFKGGGGGVNKDLSEPVSNFIAKAGDKKVTLTWRNPNKNFGGVLILRKANSTPTGVKDGDKIYNGTSTTYTDTAVTNDTKYYYRAFTYNAKKQYQTLDRVVIATPKRGIAIKDLPLGSVVKGFGDNREYILNNHAGEFISNFHIGGYENCETTYRPQADGAEFYNFTNIDKICSDEINSLSDAVISEITPQTIQGVQKKILAPKGSYLSNEYFYNKNIRRYSGGFWTRKTHAHYLHRSDRYEYIMTAIDYDGIQSNVVIGSSSAYVRISFILNPQNLVEHTPNPDGSYNIIL